MTSSFSSKLIDPSNPPFVPLDPSGRSNGILASHNILAGDILPGEPHVLHFSWGEIFPLMSQTAEPISILQSLSYDQLQAFIAIPPVPPSFDPSGMVGTDLIMSRMLKLTPIVQNKGEKIVLFGFSRMKPRHSCVPNARLLVLQEEEGMIFALRALSHIPRGSEIFISFLPDGEYPLSYPRRQDFLRSIFKFECRCPACRRSPQDQVVADANLSKVHARFLSYGRLDSPRKMFEKGGARFIKALLNGLVEIVLLAKIPSSIPTFVPSLTRLR
ncbi:hypothetical protein BDY24DRAFT_371660 [Mrakia frigida]|uniref:uncharacterized protein n=1 Tax=Mrakia frigida TaxID=29902 RepID=UPI003FCBFAAC